MLTRLEKNRETGRRACKQSLRRKEIKKIKEDKRESGSEKQVIEVDARDRGVLADD